jgi:hypothetical protein
MMPLALFPAGWHWPVVVVAVIGILAVVCVLYAGRGESEWLGRNRERLKTVAWISVGLIVIAIGVTQLNKLGVMLRRIERGDPLWLALGVGIEAFSFVGYVVLTKEVFGPEAPRLNWAAATEITSAASSPRGCSRPAARAGSRSRRGRWSRPGWPRGRRPR